MYDMRMLVLNVWTWSKEDVPDLRLTDEDVGLLRGGRVDCDRLTIGLIKYSYQQGCERPDMVCMLLIECTICIY
jgi:hypothetical protein